MRRVRSILLFCAVLTFLLLLLSLPAFAKPVYLGPAAAVPSFSDVSATHPYYQAIQGMAAAGVINGTGGGLFQPEAPVTRQQFAKMIVKSLGLTVTGTEVCPFTDVSKGGSGPDPLYPDKYVAVCATRGITTGKTATTFAPYENITRAQISTMMVRAAQNLEPGTLVTAPAWFQSSWGDFSPTHAPSANTAEYDGLFEGLQLAFFKDPTVSATRGEVAQLLWNLKNFQKQTKAGADLVTTAVVPLGEAPGGLQAALEAASGGEVEWIRLIGLAHPVNASVQVNSYYAVAGDKVFMAVAGSDGWMVKPLVASFVTFVKSFGAQVGYGGWDSNDPGNYASVMEWTLGGGYLPQVNETLDAYHGRIQPLMDAFDQQHATDEMLHLSDAALHDLLKTSTAVTVNDPAASLRGIRIQATLYRDAGQGAVIDALLDAFWPWGAEN